MTFRAYTDAQLLRRSRKDADAFHELFRRHASDIEGWLRRRSGSAEIARDLTAEVFAEAWLSQRRFVAPDDGSCGPWLQGIARNLLHSWLRRQQVDSARRKLGIASMGSVAPPDDEVVARAAVASLGDAAMQLLDGLPREQRDAVRLRVIDELSYTDVATRLGCSVEAARMRVMRGLRTLSDDLEGVLT